MGSVRCDGAHRDRRGTAGALPAPAYGLLKEVLRVLSWVTGEIGTRVDLDPAVVLAGRAGSSGLRRAGRRSASGVSRLLRTADGWCAITLSRREDVDAVPAILGRAFDGDPWTALESALSIMPSAAVEERAQLLGVPAAALPATVAPTVPWRSSRIAAPVDTSSLSGRSVVDLSSLWAGPLCARVLGRAGAQVIKVESTHRPDGFRVGDPRFFDWLHDGKEFRAIDFRSARGRNELAELLDMADIVIEASRPRALAQLGLAPEDRPHPDGQVWLSLTGAGRGDPMCVAFGDDAAVAGGLVGRYRDEPVFCADAIADPLSGICAALAVASAVRGGGGVLIDLSMRATAAAFATAPAFGHGTHPVHRRGDDWLVECPWLQRSQSILTPAAPPPGGA